MKIKDLPDGKVMEVDTLNHIQDGDLSPKMEITYRKGFSPRCWFTLSHRVSGGWKISLSEEELRWMLKTIREKK